MSTANAVSDHQRNISSRLANAPWYRLSCSVPSNYSLLEVRNGVHSLQNILNGQLQHALCYTDKQLETVSNLVPKFKKKGASSVNMKMVYVTCFNENDTKFEDTPVIKLSPDNNPMSVRYVDTVGRVYKDWEDYLVSNQLPKCKMCYTTGMVHGEIPFCPDKVEMAKSPASSWSRCARNVGDVLSYIATASLPTSKIVCVIIGTGQSGLIIGICALNGLWYLYRGVSGLWDMYTHGESINPFPNWGSCGNQIKRLASALKPLGLFRWVINWLCGLFGTGSAAAESSFSLYTLSELWEPCKKVCEAVAEVAASVWQFFTNWFTDTPLV